MPNISVLVRNVLDWYEANARDLPWRRTRDPYAIWVSEIMLQQTQVKTVLPYWERWMHAFPTIESLAFASSERVLKLWEGLGYYSRARNLHRAARVIRDKHGGNFPRDPASIRALPGIGPYTAGAIRSIAFNQPSPILDGNITRLLARAFGVRENVRKPETNRELWRLAEACVEQASRSGRKRSCSHLNQGLMELGALVCTPRNPNCHICPLRRQCIAHKEKLTTLLPRLTAATPATECEYTALVVEQSGRFWVRQRPMNQVNASLWEFPQLEKASDEPAIRTWVWRNLRVSPAVVTRVGKLRHNITRYRITLHIVRVRLPERSLNPRRARNAAPPEFWGRPDELDRLPFTGAHRKILQAYVMHSFLENT